MRATALAISSLVSREKSLLRGKNCRNRPLLCSFSARSPDSPDGRSNFYLKGLIDLPEAEEFLAPVIGQGMPIACWDAGKQLLQAGRDALHVSRPAKCSHEKAAFAFHSRQDIA